MVVAVVFFLMVVASFFSFFKLLFLNYLFLVMLARFFICFGGWVCVNDGSWVFVLNFTLFVLF